MISKVVKLEIAQQQPSSRSSLDPSRDSHLYTHLPPYFIAMKERGQQAFQPLLQTLFDHVDDALFELADRADNNAAQNMYFESMREVRIHRRGIELSFFQHLNGSFQHLLTAVDDSSDELNAGLTGLAVLANDELDELVALDGMVTKTEQRFTKTLQGLAAVFTGMLAGHRVSNDDNPFGPRLVGRAFVEGCRPLALDIKAKLVLFKLFERYVLEDLGKVYEICGQVLGQAGVALNVDQQEDMVSADDPAPVNSQADIFHDLQNLLHTHPVTTVDTQAVPASGLSAPGMAPQIPRDNLMQLLLNIQQSQIQLLSQQHSDSPPQQFDVREALGDLLQKNLPQQAMSIGQVDDDAINLVAMLFQFILDDRNLAEPLKALIARLQIPIIKVAMQDKSFFSKGGHPARKLLNEIATASLGWATPANISRDPLYKKIDGIVTNLLSDSSAGSEQFQDMLTDFVAFLELDRRRSSLVEQRTLDAEDGKAKSELARAAVQQALNERVSGVSLPKVVATLLQDAWSNVMFLICLKEGVEGDNWCEALQTVDELLWSVQSVREPGDKKKLLLLLPSLLKRLRAGLGQISYNPFEMNQLFDDLEKIHLTLLKEQPATELLSELDESALNGDFDALGELDELLPGFGSTEEVEVESTALDESAAATIETAVVEPVAAEPAVSKVELEEDDPYYSLVDQFAMGNWFELHQADDKKLRCRLAAIIRGTGRYIFVNRAGMKVLEHDRASLALAMKCGEMARLDDGLLFDRALESVIGNLRDMKSHTG